MTRFLRKLHWLDYLLPVVLATFATYVWIQIEGTLNYKWNWGIIPNYIVRYDETKGEWVANILLRGLITTVRVCIYGGLLALVFGTVLGIARCANNLTIRMLARTYVEFLRNIPPVVVLFIFYFFLSEQWSRRWVSSAGRAALPSRITPISGNSSSATCGCFPR